MWEDHRIRSYKGTNGGIAISISACDDHQNSGDTTAFTGFPTGALTYSFIQTLEQETKLTYGRLIMSMQNKIQETQKALGLNGANETQVRFYKIVNNKFKKISVSSSCLSNAFYWSCPGASTILI